MAEQERPLVDRVWEFTKDISLKVSRKAEKHWKINTLRVEIASVRHRIGIKHKELGRYVYESLKSGTLDESSYKSSINEFFDELSAFESEIMDRERRIEELEREMEEEGVADEETPPPPPPETITVESEPVETEAAEAKEETGEASSGDNEEEKKEKESTESDKA